MLKILNILSTVIKLATIIVGGVAATPEAAILLHLDVGLLGKIVSGLGTAAGLIKLGQIKVEAPKSSDFNK